MRFRSKGVFPKSREPDWSWAHAFFLSRDFGRTPLPYGAATRFEVFEFWPSDMLELFRSAGMPRRTPPPLPACAAQDSLDPPRIASPLRNVTYVLRRSKPQQTIALDAGVAGDVRRVFWFDGNSLIGERQVAEGPLPWRPAAAGVHQIRVVDDHGRSAEHDVDIRIER